MLKWSNIRLQSILLLSVCSLSIMGCSKQESDSSSEDSRRTVSFQMNVGSRDVSGMDEGMSSEREIVSLRVYAFDGTEQVGYYYTDAPVTNSEGNYTFLMDVDVRTTGSSQLLDFYVIANEHSVVYPSSFPGFTETTSLSALKGCYFEEIENTSSGGHGTPHLPMAAVHEQVEISLSDLPVSTEPGHEGHFPTGSSITLTLERSVARLGVYFAKATGNEGTLFLQKMTLLKDGRRQRNYFLPPTAEQLQDGKWDNLPFTVFEGNREITAETSVGDVDPAHYTVGNHPCYLFENSYGSTTPDAESPSGYENGVYRGNVLQVDYTVSGESKQKLVYLPAIERNGFYKVFCAVETGGVIKVTYTVADWDDDSAVLDVDYPTYTCAPLVVGDYSTEVYYSSDDELSGAFCLQFTMTQPSGRRWVSSVSGGDYKLRIFRNSTEEITDDNSQWVSSANDVYQIYVIPTRQYDASSPNGDGLLRISAPTWENQDDLLLINKSYQWNSTESDENRSVSYIRIKQVPPPGSGS